MSVDLNPHHYDNMNFIFTQQKLGSSLNFSASGGWDKEKKEKAAEKIAVGASVSLKIGSHLVQ